MTFLLSLKKLQEKGYESKQKNKIEKELPYFITIVTLLATSGFGPYFIFKKMILLKVYDPYTCLPVMYNRLFNNIWHSFKICFTFKKIF